MKEVIQEILDEEKLAREKIEKARLLARQATEKAQAKSQQLIEDARQAALQEVEQILATAKAEAAHEQTEQIGKAHEAQDAVLDNYRNEIAEAVEILFRAVPTGEKVSP